MRFHLSILAFLGACLTVEAAPPKPAKSALETVREAYECGRYGELAALAKRVPLAEQPDAQTLVGAALWRTGQHRAAETLLADLIARDKKALSAKVELGRSLSTRGAAADAKRVWNQLFDDYEGGNADRKKPAHLLAVAQAARNLKDWKSANDLFREATGLDPRGVEGARANIAWAELFLEKYDAAHAELSLIEARKVLPDSVTAHALMARVKLEQGESRAAEREITAALKRHVDQPEALAVRAEMAIDREQYDEAVRVANQILTRHPDDARAQMVLFAVDVLRRDLEQALRDKPTLDADVLVGATEFIIKQHRYEEADRALRVALERVPKHHVARAQLGANLLRLGREEEGIKALQAAWDIDPFNVRSYNLLNLFEKVIPKSYTLVAGKPFRFRVTPEDKPLIERYIRPLLEREHKQLSARYGVVPSPITVEMFVDPQHYAVRTVGLPGLEALGVCFGSVITAQSPSRGAFNWGMALWHEVAHVYAIQLSKHRVPRWFTEGLSEWETQNERPEWTRRTRAELYRALSEGKLLPILELNTGFTHARDLAHIVVAYHESAEVVAFLIRRWGFDKIPGALKQYGNGATTAEVLRKMTGLSLDELDKQFRADLAQRLAVYKNGFFVRSSDYSDGEELKEELAAHPNNARVKALLALFDIKHGQAARAADSIAALEKLPEPPKETWLAKAELLQLRKDRPGAKAALEELIKRGGDGYDARLRLGVLAEKEHDSVAAEAAFRRAAEFDPERADPWAALGKLLLKDRPDEALAAFEKAARLEVMEKIFPATLVDEYDKRGQPKRVLESAALATFIAPTDPMLQLKLARAEIALGRMKEAKLTLAYIEALAPGAELQKELEALKSKLKP